MNSILRQTIHYITVLTITALATLIYWHLYQKPLTGIDDANIYFVYIKNFVEGNGFVYNAGGEHVEGFTSLLWVLLISPLYFTGQHFELMILLLNILLVSWLLYACIKFINRVTDQKHFFSPPVYLFILILVLIPGYIDWTILSLMESSIWSFLLVMITLLLARDHIEKRTVAALSTCMVLLVFTRPESILWGFVFTLILALRIFLETKNVKQSLKICSAPFIAFIVAIAALTIFRLSYFGYPLPNTYYAKVSSDWSYNLFGGVYYFILCAFQSPLLILIALSAAFSFFYLAVRIFSEIKKNKISSFTKPEIIQLILATVSLVSLLIPVLVGGDHFQLLRRFQPFLPVYLITGLHLPFWKNILQVNFNYKLSGVKSFLIISLFIPFIYFLTKSPLHTFRKYGSPIQGEFTLAQTGRQEGDKMNKLFASLKALPSVGVSAAGGFKYRYEGEVIDLMGLNNTKMAHANKKKIGVKNHAAFEKKIFYQQSPDIFHAQAQLSSFVNAVGDTSIIENGPDFANAHINRIFKKIFTDKKFVEQYVPVMLYKENTDLCLRTYCRKDYVDTLKANGINVITLKRAHNPI